MQMFRKPVKYAQQGDRVGICVTGLDPSAIERGVLSAPGSVPLLSSAICLVKKVRFFKQVCRSKQKFHISVGHTTVVATAMFFGAAELQLYLQQQKANKYSAAKKEDLPVSHRCGDRSSFPVLDFPWEQDFEYQDDICAASDEVNIKINSSVTLKRQQDAILLSSGTSVEESSFVMELDDSTSGGHVLRHGEEAIQYALLVFQHPILVPLNTLAIGSRLETDARESTVSATHCRIAFFGPVLCPAAPAEAFLPQAAVTKDKPRIFVWKSKEAEILRLVDVQKGTGICTEAIGWKLYSKEAGISKYLGLKLETLAGDVVGYVHSSFGSTGKFKIKFPLGVTGLRAGSRLVLRYKRFIYDKSKAMIQVNCDYTPVSKRVVVPQPTSDSILLAADDIDDDNDDVNALTPRIVAGFAIDSDGEDDGVAWAVSEARSTQIEPVKFYSLNTAVPAMPSERHLVPPVDFSSLSIGSRPNGEKIAEITSNKSRTGIIDSIKPNSSGVGVVCIASGVFRIEENIREHVGSVAISSSGQSGSVIGPYAKMGKCKIEFPSSDQLSTGDTVTVDLT